MIESRQLYESRELDELTYDAEDRARYRVRDVEGANRCFRQVSALQAEIAEAEKMRDAEIEKVRQFYDGQADQARERMEFFKYLLLDFYNRNREKDEKYQLKTPWGKVVQRKVKSPQWENEAATLEWLERAGHGALVKVEKSIRKADLKKAMNEADGHYIDPATGEIVPGVTVSEKVTVSIKTD